MSTRGKSSSLAGWRGGGELEGIKGSSYPAPPRLGEGCSPQHLSSLHLSAENHSARGPTLRVSRALPPACLGSPSAPSVSPLPLTSSPVLPNMSVGLNRGGGGGHICPTGAIWQGLGTFLISETGDIFDQCQYHWQLVGGGQGCCEPSYNAQEAPQQRITRPQMSVVRRLRIPVIRHAYLARGVSGSRPRF